MLCQNYRTKLFTFRLQRVIIFACLTLLFKRKSLNIMEDSHIIEARKFKDKYLVCDIQIKTVSLAKFGFNTTSNKWLHLENWLELYAGIDRLLERNTDTLENFQSDIFYLDGAISVKCKRIRLSSSYKKILGAGKEYVAIALSICVSKIDNKALLDQVTLLEEELKQFSQKKHDSQRDKDKNLVQRESLREYVPTVDNIGLEQASVEYVPYTASIKMTTDSSAADSSGSVIGENEPYSPKPMWLVDSSPSEISPSPNAVPAYRPARKISVKETEVVKEIADSYSEEHPEKKRKLRHRPSPFDEGKVKSDSSKSTILLHKKASKKPAATNAELFGSEDSDPEETAILDVPAAPRVDSPKNNFTPLRIPNDSTLPHRDVRHKKLKLRSVNTQKSPLDGWLSKGTLERVDKSNGKSLKKNSCQIPPSERKKEVQNLKDDEKLKAQSQLEIKQIKELTALRDLIKSKRKTPPPVMDILSLNHLSSQDILSTFETIKPKLDIIFQKNSKKSKVTGFDGIDHLKTVMLIDDEKQLKMLNFLREYYQPEEKGVPSLTDLYINAMVPEWTVNVFMKEYNFTRAEAIKRLAAQEECMVHHNPDFDSSCPL